MKKRFFAALFPIALTLTAFAAVPYPHVQATAEISSSPVSHFVTLHLHLHNTGGIAAACVVKASGQKRVTGVSAAGDADVSFDALPTYKGYTVTCQVN